MPRVRLIIAYDGTRYVGWQTQPNGVAIQQMIEQALKKTTGESVTLHASGRTDSGVHARAQVAHFDTAARMDASKYAVALNTHLPSDIRVLYSEVCDPSFHARFSAKEKQYRYTLQLGAHADVFLRQTTLHIYGNPDFSAMQRAAAIVEGTHDFSAFMSSGTSMDDRVRTIYCSQWTMDGRLLHYDVTGNGFLYNMVRILAGTMLDIGMHRLPVEAMTRALTTRCRSEAGTTAPAHGLTLYRVKYDGFDTEEVLLHEG